MRLNMAIPPTTESPSNLGLIGMDPAGFPNGRRVFDDVTTIELRALAGATYALVDKSYTPDKAAGAVTQGITSSNTDVTAGNTVHYLPNFPYLGTPHRVVVTVLLPAPMGPFRDQLISRPSCGRRCRSAGQALYPSRYWT